MDAYEQLCELAKAGCSVVHLASFEWNRVRGLSIGLSRELGVPLKVWSQSTGLSMLGPEEQLVQDDVEATDPLDILQTIHAAEAAGVWLLEDFHPYLREENHVVLRWLRELARMETPHKVVVLSTPLSGLPIDLSKEVPTVELALPGLKDLETVLKNIGRSLSVDVYPDEPLLDAARGLTVMEAHLAYGKAAVRLKRLDYSAVPIVAQEKERVIKQNPVLDFYPTIAAMADVGGLGQLKEWLVRRGQAFGTGAREFGLEPPKGVLLLGVQGCGKSLLAKAVAATWQFPLLRFDMGKVFGGIVGQSEGNIRSALQVAEALAPCVLWIDEIEKGLAGMGSSDSTDGGTTARVVGTLLTWMQEKSAPVFVVATANRIDMLPPELLRKGRFDELFFVDLPIREIRKEIFAIHLRKKGREPDAYDLEELADLSSGFSGAEIEEAVREGLFDAFSQERELRTEHIARALQQTFPLSRTMRDQIEALRRWAKVRARLASADAPEALATDARGAVPRLVQETRRNPFVPGEQS